MSKEIIMSCRDMKKSFGPTQAVKNVSLEFYKGEIRTIIGENGSGKSTFCNLIAGFHQADSGEVFFKDAPYSATSPMDASRKGVCMVMQEAGTIEGLTVAENLFLGNEDEFIKFGIKNRAKMNSKAKELLAKYDLSHMNPDTDVSAYKFEDRKMLEIVKALYMNPSIFIIDETTTALSQKGRVKLYSLIKQLREEGCSIIFISHDFEEILSLSNTITVFRDGVHIGTYENDENISEDKLKLLMVGRELDGKYYRDDYDAEICEDTVLEIRNICENNLLNNISFKLNRGEILGIGGLTESGMHELGKALCGANIIDSGEVVHVESGRKITTISQAIKCGIGYVSKNRDNEALIVYDSIQNNIVASSIDVLKKGGIMLRSIDRKYANEASVKMAVKMNSVEDYVSSLSGGNKQKVALAKWIARDSDILILDCPTRGIDVMVKAAIYDLLAQLRKEGKSVILISEEILELIGMSDRILVMKDGKISGEFMRSKELSEQTLIRYMI